ncbi:MAG: RNA polymerase sigma factor [bacterium]
MENKDNISDIDLVNECKKGETWAQSALFRKYFEMVKALCFRVLGPLNRFEQEDIVQEIFLQVFASLNKFKGNAQFSTWLYSLCLNNLHTAIRKKTRMRKHFIVTENQQLYDVEDADLNNEEKSELKEKVLFLHGIINQLPLRERETFILGFIEGKHMDEISDILGRKVGTIKTWIFRARKKIQKTWKMRYED